VTGVQTCALPISKHRIDFLQAAVVLMNPNVDVASDRAGETRRKATGPIDGRLVTVVYTLRGAMVRIISARRAWKNEERAYRQTFG
jgi:uncharacterized DUF497 family protein